MSSAGARTPLRRDPEGAVIAGVCAGLGTRFGVDPVLLRIGVVVLSVATGGLMVVAYALGWLLIPSAATGDPAQRPRSRLRRGGWRVAAGAGLVALSALLVFRELGIWWSDAFVWPLVLAAFGAALLWHQTRSLQIAASAPPGPPSAARQPGKGGAGAEPWPSGASQRRRSSAADLYRGGFGIALVLGAALLFLSANDALGATREVVLATLAGVLALALILAPFLWRLGRNLALERAERIRSQERAELAAHVHDSVLQTLTLMQKRAGDPRAVATLARRQERELRTWLFDRHQPGANGSLVSGLRGAAAAVEDAHGVAVDVIAVGDRPLDDRGEAMVAATREAITNAAKFASESEPIAVYAEIQPERAQVFVRDRGGGFDPEAVPADRRGLRDSIVGRMRRHGGRATVRSQPGEGTEVELVLETEPR